MSNPNREWLRACSKQLESWPPENPTTSRVPRAKRSGRRAAVARIPRLTASRACTLAEEVVPPLPPGGLGRRGWGGRGCGRRPGGLGGQHGRVVAWPDQPELRARDRLG